MSQRPVVEPITPEIFDHLVRLAALELTEEEAGYLREELNGQLGPIAELEAIETGEGVPITSHGVPYNPSIRPALREDEAEPCAEVEAILEGAPELEDRYIVVPDIPHEELS